MGWVAYVLVGLVGVCVFAWLSMLTFRVIGLAKTPQQPVRSTPLDRTGLERLERNVDALRDEFSALKRDFRTVERRLNEVNEALGGPDVQAGLRREFSFAEERVRGLTTAAASALPPRQQSQALVSTLFEDDLLKAFNELALSFDTAVRADFVEKYKPKTVAFEAGYFRDQESGNFWLISRDEQAVVLPSGKVAREWEKLYRAMNGMQAHEALGGVYDIAPGGVLKVEAPAKAANSGSGALLLQRGQLSGI